MPRYNDNHNRGNGNNNHNGNGGGGGGHRPSCDYCGKVGHLASNCFNNPQSKSFKGGNGNANNRQNNYSNNSQSFYSQRSNQNQNQGQNQNQNHAQLHNQHQSQNSGPVQHNNLPPPFPPTSSRIDLNVVRANEGEDAVALFLAMDAMSQQRGHNGMIALLTQIVKAMEQDNNTGSGGGDGDVEMAEVE